MRESDSEGDNQRLRHRLRLIDALEQHLDGRHWDLADDNSELAADDSLTSPFQTSHEVAHCLSLSLDCLRATRMLLTDPNVQNGIRLPMAGHYPALRSGIEAGAQAIWILLPDDSSERVSRTLRARWDDVVQDNQAMLALTGPDKNDDKYDTRRKQQARKENANNVRAKKRRLKEVALAAGLAEEEMFLGLPGYGVIVEEAAEVTGVQSNFQYGIWRLVSGLTHPSASRSLTMSVVREAGASRLDGTIMAEMTASTSLTNAAIDAALMLHWSALGIASRRGNRDELVFRPSADLLPPGYEHLRSALN